MRKTSLTFLVSMLVFSVLIAGCQSMLLDIFPQGTQGVQTLQSPTATPTPQVSLPAQPDATRIAQLNRLIVWVPAQFGPDSGAAGELLQKQIDIFVENNPEVRVEIRIKSLQGPTGLLASLEKSLEIAPMAAPSLVLFPQNDFQIAANLTLIQPNENLEELIAGDDWYDYARQLVKVQNQIYGLPFAADALIMLYRPSALTLPPSNWEDTLAFGVPLLFPVDNDKALFPLNLYLAHGGPIYDEEREIALDPIILENVLDFFSEGAETGTFPTWLAQYENDDQVWAALQQKTTNLSVSWLSYYLTAFPADIAASTIPSLDSNSITLVSGWIWAFSDPLPERHDLSLSLLEHLTESEFMAEWNLLAGYLPVRPSSMVARDNQVINTLLNQVTVSAQDLPSQETLNIIGPALSEAVYNVLINAYMPSEAARIAIDQVNANK